jgi:hypothetical protein
MFEIRKSTVLVDEIHREAGAPDGEPLRRVAMMLAVSNPLVKKPKADLTEMIAYGAQLGAMMSKRIVQEFDGDSAKIEGYGKGALVGALGEVEHGYALITRPFAKPIRKAFGENATAWMTSTVKRATLGGHLDVPIASKQALFVRTHYDTIDVHMPDAPLPDEVVVVLVATNRGRLHARIGGLELAEVGERGHDEYLDRE